jgi:WD40 repeat protein
MPSFVPLRFLVFSLFLFFGATALGQDENAVSDCEFELAQKAGARLARSRDGKFWARIDPGSDKLAILEGASKKVLSELSSKLLRKATTLSLDPLGGRVAVGTRNGKIVVWDLSAKTPAQVFSPKLLERSTPVTSLAFSSREANLLVASHVGWKVKVIHLGTGIIDNVKKPGNMISLPERVHEAAISLDGNHISTATGLFHDWTVDTGLPIWLNVVHVFKVHRDGDRFMVGKAFAYGDQNRSAQMGIAFRVPEGGIRANYSKASFLSLNIGDALTTDFSRDGTLVAAGFDRRPVQSNPISSPLLVLGMTHVESSEKFTLAIHLAFDERTRANGLFLSRDIGGKAMEKIGDLPLPFSERLLSRPLVVTNFRFSDDDNEASAKIGDATLRIKNLKVLRGPNPESWPISNVVLE